MVRPSQYALYKGDDLLALGTMKEIAKKRGVTVKTLVFMRSPAYKRRTSEQNAQRLIRLEDEK